MKRFVEDYPSVDIGLLKRRGLFEASGEAVEITFVGEPLRFRCEPSGGILVSDAAGRRSHRLSIETRTLRYGQRRYFMCPKTGRRATKLYLVDGELASREGHGLVHLITTNRPADVARAKTVHRSTRLSGAALGKGPARGRRRKALVDALASIGDTASIGTDAAGVIHRDRLNRRSGRREEDEAQENAGSSTRYALEAGRRSEDGWTEEEVLEALSEPLELALKGTLDTASTPDFAPDWLAQRARLDVRTLHHAGLLEVEELRAAALKWDRDSTGVINYVLMAADFRDPDHPFLVIKSRDTYEHVDYFQIIQVEYCAGRWYFRCPISHARRTTLYLREGLFGSDKALNLRKRGWDSSEDPELDPDDYDLHGDEPDEDYPV